MKKLNFLPVFLCLSICFGITALAQKDTKTNPRFEKFMNKVKESKGIQDVPVAEKPTANHFYKTYQDYLNNKPAPGILLSKGRTEIMGTASYTVDRNGNVDKAKVKDLADEFWGFCDRFGVLYRLTEKDAYLVIIAGNITQYVRTRDCSGTLNNDSTFTLLFGMSGQGGYFDYASKGVNGEIIALEAKLKNGKSGELEKMMADHPEVYQKLLEDEDQEKYIKDKYRKRENLTFKLQHYIREYNKL